MLALVPVRPPVTNSAFSGGAIDKRVTAGAEGRETYAIAAAAIAVATLPAIKPALLSAHVRRRGTATGCGIIAASFSRASASSISSRASALSATRRLRSFSRQRRSSFRIVAGVLTGSALQSGSFVMMNANVSVTSSPANARLPVSIS